MFGKSLGVSRASLAYYERGERTPDANVLSRYRTDLGVSLEWLLTGAGEMFADPSVVPSGPSFHTIKPDVFREVGRLVTKLHKAEGITLPPDALFDEQSSAYNALIERAEDPADANELTSLLPWLASRIKRNLLQAKAEPGAGKREA